MSEVAVNGAPVGTGAPYAGGQLSRHQAHELTKQIRTTGDPWDLIAEAYTRGAWSVLGYRTWRAYCTGELGGVIHPYYGESRRVVTALHEAGLSARAIAVVTGLSRSVVTRNLAKLGRANRTSHEPHSGDLPQGRPDPQPQPGSVRSPHPSNLERLDALVYQLKGMSIALGQYTRDEIDRDQAERWSKELDNSAARLRRFSADLKESIRAN